MDFGNINRYVSKIMSNKNCFVLPHLLTGVSTLRGKQKTQKLSFLLKCCMWYCQEAQKTQ